MEQCWRAGSGAARYSESDAIRDGVHRYGVLGGNLDTAADAQWCGTLLNQHLAIVKREKFNVRFI